MQSNCRRSSQKRLHTKSRITSYNVCYTKLLRKILKQIEDLDLSNMYNNDFLLTWERNNFV